MKACVKNQKGGERSRAWTNERAVTTRPSSPAEVIRAPSVRACTVNVRRERWARPRISNAEGKESGPVPARVEVDCIHYLTRTSGDVQIDADRRGSMLAGKILRLSSFSPLGTWAEKRLMAMAKLCGSCGRWGAGGGYAGRGHVEWRGVSVDFG